MFRGPEPSCQPLDPGGQPCGRLQAPVAPGGGAGPPGGHPPTAGGCSLDGPSALLREGRSKKATPRRGLLLHQQLSGARKEAVPYQTGDHSGSVGHGATGRMRGNPAEQRISFHDPIPTLAPTSCSQLTSHVSLPLPPGHSPRVTEVPPTQGAGSGLSTPSPFST